MYGPVLGYVRISDNPLMWPLAAVYNQFGPQNFVFG